MDWLKLLCATDMALDLELPIISQKKVNLHITIHRLHTCVRYDDVVMSTKLRA
jgi:hypothetical protein